MFRYIVESSTHTHKRNAYVLPLSIVAHLVAVGIAIIVPIFAPGVLPVPAATLMAFISAAVPAPPPPPAPASHVTRGARTTAEEVNPLLAPVTPPQAIAAEGVNETTRGVIQGVEGGDGNAWEGVIGNRLEPPPPPPAAEPSVPLHVGGLIRPPTKIHDVMPVYPAIAQARRVSGRVVIEATIGPTGDVLDAKVLRSSPLLDAAALDAVRRWQFTPTLLNGKAIAVVMTVTVDFKLQ